MAYFSTSNTCHAAYFTHGKWREVVVQHETLFGFAFKFLYPLHVIGRAQGGGDQRLGFAASEDGRAVCAGQHADFNRDGTNFIERAPIRAAPFVRDLITENPLP